MIIQIKIVIVFLALVLILLVYRVFFIVNKLEVNKEPEYLFPDGNSTITIYVKPYNKLGMEIPFKKVNVIFEIIEGRELIEIVSKSPDKLILRSNYKIGVVIIHIKNSYTFLPIEINVEIIGQLV